MKKQIEKLKVYIPLHFKAFEFVPEEVYRKEGATCFKYIDPRILWSMDKIREYFNDPKFLEEFPVIGKIRKVFVNTWAWGGRGKYRCFNPPTVNIGSRSPLLHLGKAVQFNVQGISAADVTKFISSDKEHDAFKYIQHFENKLTYVYMDCENIKSGQNKTGSKEQKCQD